MIYRYIYKLKDKFAQMKKKHTKILLVDDEPDILEIVGYNLKQEGYQIFTAANGKEAIAKAKKELPDLIIMDVMMPEMDGMEACENIRKIPELSNVIITFLTARSEDYSQVAGFDAGADDYIAKPIKPKLLVSKVKALLRRLKETEQNSETLNVGGIEINREEYKIVKDDIEIALPRKEFELFYLLASKPGKVFKRDEILDKVWGNEVVVGGRTIDVHIRKLREKIGEDFFKTIKGVGYKFEV
ncbi:MAG: two-component system alkaline phosphatase synthesis response regulator PhoP [Porticoccaceae bacterium]|jgi:two-component system alkaline phosphatase synthesis response regulator PhoP